MNAGMFIGVFAEVYEPSHGRCPACHMPLDEFGCVIRQIGRLVSTDDRPVPAHRIAWNVECFGPNLFRGRHAERVPA